ncbi:hypothetical protein SCALM49S_10345 [Streptomyces californicus]
MEELRVEEQRQLRHRHPVRLGDLPAADERAERRVQHWPQRLPPGHRVRPVQHDDALARERGRLQAVVERPDVRVEARARVLDVEEDRVHARGGEHVGQVLPVLEVRVVDRQPGRRVVVAPLGAARLRGAPETVLRAEHGRQLHPGVRMHDVHDVPYVGGDPGRVGDDPDLLAPQHPVAVGRQPVEAGAHPAASGAVAVRGRGRRGTGAGRRRRQGSHRASRGQHTTSGQAHSATSMIVPTVMATHASAGRRRAERPVRHGFPAPDSGTDDGAPPGPPSAGAEPAARTVSFLTGRPALPG